MKATVRQVQRKAHRLGFAVRVLDPCRGEEDDDCKRHQDDADRLELTTEIGGGTLLDRLGDLFHLRRAFVESQHVLREQEADRNGQYRRRAGEPEHCPLAASEDEVLVAAFGSNH
jgi:hypothetical protein